MYLDFLAHGEPFTLCNHGVRIVKLWGTFLSIGVPSGVSAATSSGFPARARAGHLVAVAEGLTFLMDSQFVLRLRSVSAFTRPGPSPHQRATPLLLPPSKRRPLRQRSPHPNRIVGTISPVAYTLDLPTIGRRRTSPVMTQVHFLQAAACITPNGPPSVTAWLEGGRSSEFDPQCFTQGRCLAHHKGRNAVSRSLPAWLLRRRPLSGPPGGTTLAAYLR